MGEERNEDLGEYNIYQCDDGFITQHKAGGCRWNSKTLDEAKTAAKFMQQLLDKNNELHVAASRIATLEQQLAKSESLVEDLKRYNSTMSRAASSAEEEIEDSQERIAELEDQLAEKDKQLDAVRAKLPVTADGVPVVPNVDTVWIDSNEHGGWPHDAAWVDGVIRVETWTAHRDTNGAFDHIWLLLPDADEGDHWFGKIYSTREAAEKAATHHPGRRQR